MHYQSVSKFHPLGLAVTNRETHLDYKFVCLDVCLDKGLDMMGLDRPTCRLSLVADAAESITNGFLESTLGNRLDTRIVCWFHFKKAIDKRLTKIASEQHRDGINSGIRALQLCKNIYDVICNIFTIFYVF
jgi:hypothetical protein